jgi:hypothetical protein
MKSGGVSYREGRMPVATSTATTPPIATTDATTIPKITVFLITRSRSNNLNRKIATAVAAGMPTTIAMTSSTPSKAVAAAASPVSRLPLAMPATTVSRNSAPASRPTVPSQRICCRPSGSAPRARTINDASATKALTASSTPAAASSTLKIGSRGSIPTGFVTSTPSISSHRNGSTAKPRTVTTSDDT